MLRPWWFPEYTPSQQRIFDTIVAILTKHYEKRWYQHIMTPAVEPVSILTRGGDIWDKQVYGLYGLAQWNEDTKDYALHFDLTIPFARYVLDHMNDLVFPFKRYQMQPVWRWERTKRGRYKEFWQFDIDAIWKTGSDVWYWYDVETITVSYNALKEIFTTLWIQKDIIVKVSNIVLAKAFLTSLWAEGESNMKLCGLLDDYFKLGHEKFLALASDHVQWESLSIISSVLLSKDHSYLKDVPGYSHLVVLLDTLKNHWVHAEFDLAIIRWHNYYTGTVLEMFLEEDMEIGALAWWWAYDGLTNFIDEKRSFSGVGCSISSRIMEIILSLWGKLADDQETFVFINFEDTFQETLELMHRFHVAGKSAEIYPSPTKISKQFEYADKKWATYCVLYGKTELEKGEFVLKNLRTGESITKSLDDWLFFELKKFL